MEYLANRKEIENPLSHFLEHGIKMIPLKPNKIPPMKWKDHSVFSNDPEQIREWQKHYKGFYGMLSLGGGFIVLDLDEKSKHHGKSSFLKTCIQSGVTFPYSLNEWPAVTVTPSGGLHLWLRYSGPPVPKIDNGDGVEVFHHRNPITLPGSVLDKGTYHFFGDLSEAPRFPEVLFDVFKKQGAQKRREEADKAKADRESGNGTTSGVTTTPAVKPYTQPSQQSSKHSGYKPDRNRMSDHEFESKYKEWKTLDDIWDSRVDKGFIPADEHWNPFLTSFIYAAKYKNFHHGEVSSYLKGRVPTTARSYGDIDDKIRSIYGL